MRRGGEHSTQRVNLAALVVRFYLFVGEAVRRSILSETFMHFASRGSIGVATSQD